MEDTLVPITFLRLKAHVGGSQCGTLKGANCRSLAVLAIEREEEVVVTRHHILPDCLVDRSVDSTK